MQQNMDLRNIARLAIVLATASFVLSSDDCHSGPPDKPAPTGTTIGEVPVAEVQARMGAKFENGASRELLDNYANHFTRTDPNRDGKHTRAEYVDGGRYMTPQARAGIFRAADENGDGVVTEPEYVLNRIVTDEGKEIFQAMDDNRNGTVDAKEFVRHANRLLKDETLAKQLFAKLDRNHDDLIPIPEYLQIWGKWAREGRGSAQDRIEARRRTLAVTPPVKGKEPSATHQPPRGDSNPSRPRGSRPAQPPSVEQVFQRFDRNRDGELVKSEIPGFVQPFILPADSDKSGGVSRKELESYRGQNRGNDRDARPANPQDAPPPPAVDQPRK